MERSSQCGAVTLEACISVLAFLILLLFLSGLFLMFMAQNVTSHAILETAQSLSLDAHTIESLKMKDDGSPATVSGYVSDFVAGLFGSSSENPYYVTDSYWYNGDAALIAQVVRTRFIGYLSGGDEEKADASLSSMNVVDGLEGLDFSQSYVEDGILHIVLKYQLEHDFNLWGIGTIDVEQQACSKLWK